MAGLEGERLTSEVLIRQAESVEDLQLVRGLFTEYETAIGVSLCFQSFEEELANLPGKYAPPSGRLFLAFIGELSVGCIALRKQTDAICEMKRLFVRQAARGKQVGRKLVETIINEACDIGYQRMRLDTMPGKMDKAIAMYRSVGFEEIPPYYDTPVGDTIFMELKLSR